MTPIKLYSSSWYRDLNNAIGAANLLFGNLPDSGYPISAQVVTRITLDGKQEFSVVITYAPAPPPGLVSVLDLEQIVGEIPAENKKMAVDFGKVFGEP